MAKVVDVTRITTSCGYAVPRMELVEQRENLKRLAKGKGEAGLVDYRAATNAHSIDGLAGYSAARLVNSS